MPHINITLASSPAKTVLIIMMHMIKLRTNGPLSGH